jgi:hypothetical protein
MASIRKEILLDARPEEVWDAVRDIGALHTRLVPGFVTDTRLEEGARIVTFGNGMVVRELIVDLDDQCGDSSGPRAADSRTTTRRPRFSPRASSAPSSSGRPTSCRTSLRAISGP